MTRNQENEGWFTPGRFALLLAVLVVVLYPQVVFGLQTFVFRDFGHCIYPMGSYLRESLLRGEIPLWNPLSSCGVPFLAQWNVQALYPPALLYVLFPLSWALGFFCLLHLYLGGLGMYFLARRWTGNNFAAAFAGVVFAFSGVMINSLIWQATIAALGCMPWVVLFTERAWREGGKMIAVAAIAGGLEMLSGSPEIVLATWLLLGCLWLIEFCQKNAARWKLIWRAGTVILLVAGLSAAQLLPFFDVIKYSQRESVFDPGVWPMPLSGWANFLVPLYHSSRSFQGIFMQPEQSWTNSYYLGVITIALSFLAVWRVREKRIWLLGGLTLFCLVLAWGEATPLYHWLRLHVGIISLMRFPVKFVILPVFILPLMAAFALATIGATTPEAKARKQTDWWAIGGVTMGVLVWILYSCDKYKRPGEDTTFIVWNGIIRGLLFLLLMVLLWFAGKTPRWQLKGITQFAVLVLMWFDLAHYAPLPPTINRSYYQPDLPRQIQPASTLSRAMISPKARAELEHLFFPDPADDFLRRRIALQNNCNLLDHISKVDGFFSIRLKEHENVFYLLYDETATNPPAAPLLDFLGVAQITSETNLFTWESRTNFMPLITGGQRPIFGDKQLAYDALGSTNFDPRTEVYLPLEAKPFIAVTNASAITISKVQAGAQSITADVQAQSMGIVVIAQNFYHPWHAYLDGIATPLWHANYAFQALETPSGTHKLKLVYEDRAFYVGMVISAFSFLGCIIGYFVPRKIERETRS